MAFTALDQLFTVLETQENWKGQKQFQTLLLHWNEVVGSAVCQHTRPIDIQRNVLQVATSSAAWAQNLAFERLRILKKLNDRLPLNLKDIRFSTAHWHADAHKLPMVSEEIATLWQNHPSQLIRSATNLPHKSNKDPQAAFLNWAREVRSRDQALPHCPSCHCPTPPGELARWSVCSLCAAQKFQSYREPKD